MYNLTTPVEPWRISEDILIYFVSHCYSVLKLRYSTIKSYLCGIRFNALRTGQPNPLLTSVGHTYERLQTILRAVKKEQGLPTLKRLPVTIDILRRMCAALQLGVFSPYVDLLLSTVCCVAFFGFLRCGEFTCQVSFDPTVHLCIHDVSFYNNDAFATLQLKTSKTDPFRRGVTIYLHSITDRICPVKALRKYIDARRASGATSLHPLFVNPENNVLQRGYFLSKLKELLSRLGLAASDYSGHSFRIGAATSAANAQVEDHLIKVLGRWHSDSYSRYIHTSRESVCLAQRAMCQL